MNAISIPGFTAENSLYKSRGHYKLAVGLIAVGVDVVSAQALRTSGRSSGRSCSSKSGNMDCYCTGGCCRTQDACTCCGGSQFMQLAETPSVFSSDA